MWVFHCINTCFTYCLPLQRMQTKVVFECVSDTQCKNEEPKWREGFSKAGRSNIVGPPVLMAWAEIWPDRLVWSDHLCFHCPSPFTIIVFIITIIINIIINSIFVNILSVQNLLCPSDFCSLGLGGQISSAWETLTDWSQGADHYFTPCTGGGSPCNLVKGGIWRQGLVVFYRLTPLETSGLKTNRNEPKPAQIPRQIKQK